MNIPEYFEWSVTQNLAYRVVEKLDGFAKVIEDKNARRIEISGDLPLAGEEFSTQKQAECIFRIDSQWLSRIPEVVCLEPWVTRKIPEWHVYDDGRLCFEFNLKWEQELPAMVDQYTFGLTASYAAQWLTNSCRWLLNRHLFASRNGIRTWPKSWDYWAHDVIVAKRQLMTKQMEILSHA